MSSGEISILLRDRVPSRTIVYPIGVAQFNQALEGVVSLSDVALYFLYRSSEQSEYYDPAKSSLERYPVLVARSGLPQLKTPVLAGDLEENPEARSILVFPVKARLKAKVSQALKEQGMRLILRWLTAKSSPDVVQRPLVLVYDETTHRIAAKFAEEWDGPEIERRYY